MQMLSKRNQQKKCPLVKREPEYNIQREMFSGSAQCITCNLEKDMHISFTPLSQSIQCDILSWCGCSEACDRGVLDGEKRQKEHRDHDAIQRATAAPL